MIDEESHISSTQGKKSLQVHFVLVSSLLSSLDGGCKGWQAWYQSPPTNSYARSVFLRVVSVIMYQKTYYSQKAWGRTSILAAVNANILFWFFDAAMFAPRGRDSGLHRRAGCKWLAMEQRAEAGRSCQWGHSWSHFFYEQWRGTKVRRPRSVDRSRWSILISSVISPSVWKT